MNHRRILITAPVRTREQFYDELARATYQPDRPAPRTLDAMADLLKEFGVETIILANVRLSKEDRVALRGVLTDLGVELKR